MEELLKEFKTFRDQVYAKFADYDEVLRILIGSNAEKIVSTFTDENALKVMDLYPMWAVGITVAVGDRYQYDGKLYKCIQAHTTQADWTPDKTPALWTLIDVTQASTIDDPIPVPSEVSSFEYAWGKYYIEGETIYLCNREGGQEGDTYTLNFKPSELIGHYFEVVEQ